MLSSPFGNRSIEFFEGADGKLKMPSLLCFLSFFPASYVVVATQSENALGWYLGAYVLGYVGGKSADAIIKRNKGDHHGEDS